MRLLLLITIVLLPVRLFADDEERSLMQRLLDPNTNRVSQFDSKTFHGTGNLEDSLNRFDTKEYQSKAGAPTKGFDVRAFLGLKRNQEQEKEFQSGSAQLLEKGQASDATREFRSDAFGTRKAEEAGQTSASASQSSEMQGREADPNPSAQGAITEIGDRLKGSLSIDEIRELLNRKKSE